MAEAGFLDGRDARQVGRVCIARDRERAHLSGLDVLQQARDRHDPE